MIDKISYLFCGISIGIILFQTSVVAPVVFSSLSGSSSSKFLRLIFPRFFILLTLISGSVVFISLVSADHSDLICSTISTGFSIIAYSAIPATNRAKDEDRTTTFKNLHILSITLTLGIGLSNIFIIII